MDMETRREWAGVIIHCRQLMMDGLAAVRRGDGLSVMALAMDYTQHSLDLQKAFSIRGVDAMERWMDKYIAEPARRVSQRKEANVTHMPPRPARDTAPRSEPGVVRPFTPRAADRPTRP